MNQQRVATDITINYDPNGGGGGGGGEYAPSKGLDDLKEVVQELSHEPLDTSILALPSLTDYYPETATAKSSNSQAEGAGSSGRILFWYHPDYLGNVDLVTEIDGFAHEFFIYNPWGEEMHQWNANTYAFTSPYRFNSKELDPETGLAYYGARYYQNKIGVWLSVDPKSVDAPSWSPYSYSTNNPVVFADPDGQLPIPVITGMIGAVGGAIYGLATGKSWTETTALAAGGFVAGATLGFGTAAITAVGGVATLGGAGTSYLYGAIGVIGGGLSNLTEQGTMNLLGAQEGFNENEFVMSLAFGIPETMLSKGVTGPISNSIKGLIARELTKEATFKQEKQFLKQTTKSLKEMSGGQITNKQARIAAQKMYNVAKTEQGVIINATIRVTDKAVDVLTVTAENGMMERIKE
jgi:RHS repeat-associated protein